LWCNLLKLNLNHSHFENLNGVYIIWHGGKQPATVRIGQGVIKDRLSNHRSEQEILAFSNLGLLVTWAQTNKQELDGIERYLAESLNPKVGDRFPTVYPIQVNLPW
jgi:hypothetical protein